MLEYAVHGVSGPVAVRYPRGGEGRYTGTALEAEAVIREGRDITVVCYGTMINEVLDAADQMLPEGISPEIIKLGTITPNDFDLTLYSLKKTGRLLVVEEVCAAGCVGSRVITQAALMGVPVERAALMNLGEGIVVQGAVPELRRLCRIDARAIAEKAGEMCRIGRS